MYQKITEITDQLFHDIEMTEEAQALKEELTADLNERYADLLASGLGEEAATRQIMEDLTGFSELTSAFPRRERALSVPAPGTIPVSGIREIRVSLGADDLQVIPSEDALIHLELDSKDGAQWHSERDGSRLSLEVVRPEESKKAAPPPDADYSLNGLLQRAARMLVEFIDTHSPCRATLLVPANWRGALTVNTGSGDVRIGLPLESLTVRTGSGDGDIRLYEGTQDVRINSASGDMNVSGAAGNVSVSTTSGDIDLEGQYAALRVTTTSGDADLTRVSTGSLECKSTSGDFDFRGEAREVVYNTVSGDIELELYGELRRIKGSAVSGDAEITLADRQPSDVKANTVTGDCEVNCQPGPDPAIIQLTSVSGDITVR